MDKIRRINKDVYVAVCLIAFSIFFLGESGKMHPGAAEFPGIILGIFLILSIGLLAGGIRKTMKNEILEKSDKPIGLPEMKYPFLVAGVSLAYLAAIQFIGFYIATVVVTPVYMVLFGMRKPATILVVTASINLFIYVLFTKLLSVYLP